MAQTKEINLETPRLLLRPPSTEDESKILYFYQRNKHHLALTEPTLPLALHEQLVEWTKEIAEGRSIRFLIFLKGQETDELIGFCNFTQIFRGAFHACYLGFKIDADHEGEGFMTEALREAIRYMFEEQKIHRIMANYLPTNTRSGKLLYRLGFIFEGYARDYLLIDGKWQDHILTSLTNSQ